MIEQWTQLLDECREPDPEAAATPRHEPTAAVLACADARVSPSAIFGQPPGSLFTVRVAGNTASPAALASLDYAVEHLGVDLIMVLGHTDCGAVAAAIDGACHGSVEAITGPICEIVRANPDVDATHISRLNVIETMATLEWSRGATGARIRSGDVRLVGGVYDLSTGRVVAARTPQTH